MIEIRVESSEGKIEQAWALFLEHREELTTNKELMELYPDREKYAACESAGMLLCLWAYDDGELVGYSVNFLSPNMHYSKLRMCHNDLLFLTKKHREGRTGLRLIRETEAQAKARGVQFMIWHAKPGTAFDALIPKLGYRVQDIMYSKILE